MPRNMFRGLVEQLEIERPHPGMLDLTWHDQLACSVDDFALTGLGDVGFNLPVGGGGGGKKEEEMNNHNPETKTHTAWNMQ